MGYKLLKENINISVKIFSRPLSLLHSGINVVGSTIGVGLV